MVGAAAVLTGSPISRSLLSPVWYRADGQRRQDVVIGICARPGCGKRRSPDGEPRADCYCKECRAQISAKSFRKNRKARNGRRRERAELRSTEQIAMDSARAKVAMALKRGQLKRGRCVRCSSSSADVTALILDPAKALEVVWVCRDDRKVEIESRRAPAKLAWKSLGERFAAEWPLLPPEIQERLQAEVAGLGAIRIARARPDSIFFRQQLVLAFGRYCASSTQ